MNPLAAFVFGMALQAAGKGVWIDAESGNATPCELAGRRWQCADRGEVPRGILIVMSGDRVEIASTTGVENVDAALAQWGRLVRVEAGGAAAGDLHDLALTAWIPERPAVRAQLRRFRAIRDESVRVLKLSAAVFWLSGGARVDADAFLSLDGPGIGSVRIATHRLLEDAPDVPFVIAAPAPTTIVGRVRNVRGDDVATASVDLLQPLRGDPDQRLNTDTPVIGRSSTTTDANGSFSFERAVETPALIIASSAEGRGSAWVMTLGPPVVIDLTPPLRARGRVLRRRLPLAGARIRFVPSVEAWSVSFDPAANLAAESVSGDDGRFDVALPEHPAGGLQIVATDGATARVSVLSAPARTRVIDLGDVSIPDPLRIIVRLLEPMQTPGCDLLAIGPLGSLGLQALRASSAVNVYTLDLPESGPWTFSADCGGRVRSLVPMVTTVPSATSDSAVPFDLRFSR